MQQQFHRPVFSIFDILDRVLDKGLVIDANISLSMLGIEMGVIRARILAAGITTFLRYAAALGLTKAPAIQMPIALL
ncbi:MAG: hypothetical protein AUH71_00245 [Thaumarchaeota archaeon 13_1_40CM_4_48_7]|nr:MAG: hypothetical protein AUH71_00245 [Thaumarchaeota archaeon 13_1_40CM_4_48_7]